MRSCDLLRNGGVERYGGNAVSPRKEPPMTDPDRRTALSLVAGLAVGASTLALAGCKSEEEKKGEGGEEVTANEDLMREHGVLRRILVAYREVAPRLAAGTAVDAAALASAATLFRTFGEHYHEQLLEEQHIFPIVRKAGGEAGRLADTLVAQHARGREINDFIIGRTQGGKIGDGPAMAKAMTAFARMYEAHAAREDTIVFPAFKKAVGPKGYDELGDQFEDIERKTFGGDGFDIAMGKIGDIERALGLADLAGFTAPPPAAA
jgi:hemerythrin-like domain-containing protein